MLTDIHRTYSLPPVFITENGMAANDVLLEGAIHDSKRIEYIDLHLKALAKAIAEGVDVRGYFYWSLMDNFEWSYGFGKRFGLIHIDYQTQLRTLKDSAVWYRNYIQRERSGAKQKEATL